MPVDCGSTTARTAAAVTAASRALPPARSMSTPVWHSGALAFNGARNTPPPATRQARERRAG